MQFKSKFSLMLNIFDVKNLDLADAVGIDRTLISKWRSGQRKPAYESHQIILLGNYFADIMLDEEKAKLFKSLFGISENTVFPNRDELSGIFSNWFCDDDESMSDLINLLSLNGNGKATPPSNSMLASSILFFEGLEGFLDAFEYLVTFLKAEEKSNITVCMDYHMHIYLMREARKLSRNFTFLKHLINNGHHIDYLMNVNDYNLPTCFDSFASFLDKDNYRNIALHTYNVRNPTPNYFIMIDDEVIEYGSFSDDAEFSPIVAHITTNKGTIDLFKNTYNNILRFSHPLSFADLFADN